MIQRKDFLKYIKDLIKKKKMVNIDHAYVMSRNM